MQNSDVLTSGVNFKRELKNLVVKINKFTRKLLIKRHDEENIKNLNNNIVNVADFSFTPGSNVALHSTGAQ